MKKCENCGNEHDGTYGSGRFCSKKCKQNYCTSKANNGLNTIIICNKCNKKIKKRFIKKHILKHIKEEEIEKTIFICEYCGNKFYGKLNNTNRFCCKKCARGFSTKEKRKEINEKVSKKLKIKARPKIIKKCAFCNKEFIVKWSKRNQQCCSNLCAVTFWANKPEQKEMFSRRMKKRHEAGDLSIGWQTRKKMNMTTLEKIAYDILIEKNIKFEREYKVGKWFIDFAIIDVKAAIEMDGRQHNDEKRKNSDIIKDNYLKNKGWKIIRIKYYENKEQRILEELNDLNLI